MKNILVVCIGNICRSPMAQGILATQLPQVSVSSAGIGALVGMPADDKAQSLMRMRGIDIGGHFARQVTQGMCTQSDLILVMDSEQRRHLEEAYTLALGMIFRLGEFSKKDIPDPYGQSQEAFRDVLTLIDEGVHEWLHRIQKL